MVDYRASSSSSASDSENSQTFPVSVGSLKKGGYVMLKGKPCKIVEITTAKPGKHGSTKAIIVGTDIFTDKKYEASAPTSSNIDVPEVFRKEYHVLGIKDEATLSLQLKDSTLTEEMKLLSDKDSAEMMEQLASSFGKGKKVLVSVITALNKKKIVSFRELKD